MSNHTETSDAATILVGVDLGLAHFDGALEELSQLAVTAGLDPVARVTCKRKAPDAALFLGSGKADEIKLMAQQLGASEIVFDQSLSVLRPRGTMVTFGNASGPVDPISPLVLSANGSLFLTRPTLFDYIADRADLERRAADLFAWMGAGQLDVRIGHTFPMSATAEAHRAIEARTTTGKVLLIPDA